MSLHFAYGRTTLSSSDWSITVNTGGGNLTGATKYFSLQAQNPIGKNLQLISSPITFQTGDSITFTINESALTEAEGWTHYVIGVSNSATASTFNQIARINIYDLSTGSIDFDTQEVFPLTLTIDENAQLETATYVADKESLPTTNLIYGMRRGVTENNYIYEYNPFSTLVANDDDILSADVGVWLKKEEFSTYVEDIAQYGGCAYDLYNLNDFSQVELPAYNADGTNSLRVKYYLINNSSFTLQPGTGITLSAQIGGVERTEIFEGKIYYRINGVVTPTDGTLRTTSTITGQPLDFINTDYVYTKATPVTISKDYINNQTGLYIDVYVNFLNLEFNNLLPDGYLQIFLSYITPKGVFTPVGTLFEKGIIYNKYNKRRVLPDIGLNVVVGEGEGLVKNFAWYSCNTTVSGLTANTANQKLYVNINGVVFPDTAERTSSVLRAIVDTTVKESKISTWTSYSAVTTDAALTVTVDYECDSDLNQQIRDTYPDVIAGDWGIFNPTRLNIYVQRQSDGEIRKFTGFIPAGNNVSQEFIITDWSSGTVVGSVPASSASFFDPTTNTFSTTASAGNFTSGNYRVAHTYVWNGDTVSDVSHSVAAGCISESQVNGEQVFGTTTYNTIAQIKAEDDVYDGLQLYCKNTQQLYVYDENSTLDDDDNFVLLPNSGVGRWVSVSITSGSNNSIELSENVTWYVSPTGNADNDGLTVGTPITLEEAASRVFRVDPTINNLLITIELADGNYTYANNYNFVHPDAEFLFDIELKGRDWVGIESYPTANISTRTLSFRNFKNYSYVRNVHYSSIEVIESQLQIENVVCKNYAYIYGQNTYVYVTGVYKFSQEFTYAFNVVGGYLDLDAPTFDSGGTTRNYGDSFIRLLLNAKLYLSSPVTKVGTFTGTKLTIGNGCIYDGFYEEYITSLPGNVDPVYPTYIFAPSNTLATTASLGTAAALDVNEPNGVCGLDGSGKVSSTYLPSYVDDVLEYANLAGFPVTGETGKIYVALDNNKVYRWSGSVYVEVSNPFSGSYDDLTDKPTIPTTAAEITVDTTNLNVNLSGADNTVQKAIETLDELVVGVGSGEVADNLFRIQDNTDATKQIAFEASGITTGTTRTLTAPDASGTLVSTDTLTDKALYYYDAASKLFKPVGIGTAGQALIAQPSSNPPYQWATASGGREVLTADRTYFVRTDGSDSNNGLTNTSGGAFLTPAKAFSTLSQLDGGGYSATVKITGTFTTTINIVNSFVGFNSIILEGDTITPSNSTINVSSGDCISCDSLTTLTIVGLRLLNSGAGGNGIAISRGLVNYGSIEFGAMTTSGRHILIGAGTANVLANYTISGGCFEHVLVQGGISVFQGAVKTITLTGTPNFAGQFISANTTGTVIAYLLTFSGSATGKRYDVNSNGVVNTYGGGANYFPGSVAGTTSTGGQYA